MAVERGAAPGARPARSYSGCVANIAFARVRKCYVLVQNKNAATDEEWSKWVAFVSKGGEVSVPSMRVLIFSAGGSPTPKQRASIHALMPKTGGGVETAIVTASFVGRSVVGAMNLFNPKVRAFSPERVSDALDYLDVAAPDRPEGLDLAARLHHELGLPFTKRT